MPELQGNARRDFLLNVMLTIHSRRYIYTPGQRGYAPGGAVPAPGSGMNCEGAAHLMWHLATTTCPPGGILANRLRVVHVQDPNRILFPWVANMKLALGNAHPSYVRNVGWIFDNHYRIRDLTDGNRLYDPTFCTVSPDNYDSIRGSVPMMIARNNVIVEVFGERYLVITQGQNRDRFELHARPIQGPFSIQDLDFQP